MKYALGTGLLTCILTASSAYAENDTCVALARIVGVNHTKYLAVDQQRSVAKADMCSADYHTASSSKKAQIAAAYSVYSLNASGSDDEIQAEQHSACEGHFGDYWRNQINTKDALEVSTEGASVIKECLALVASELIPNLSIANDGKKIHFSVQWRPSAETPLKISLFGPTDLQSDTCIVTKDGKAIPLTEISDAAQILHSTESVTVDCERSAHTVKIDGVDRTCTDETIFEIATNGPTSSMIIPRVCKDEIQTSELYNIRQSIKNLNDRMGNVPTTTAMDNSLKKVNSRIDEFKFALTDPKGDCPSDMEKRFYFYWPTDESTWEKGFDYQAGTGTGPFEKGGRIAGGQLVENVYLCVRK